MTVAVIVLLSALVVAPFPATADDERHDEDEAQERPARLADLPPAARSAIARVAGDRPIVEIEKRVVAGVTIYEAEYEIDGLGHCVEVSASGELIALEKEVAPASLPAALRDAVIARHPKGRIREAAAVHPAGAALPGWYEVEVEVGGRQRTLRVRPSGEIVR